MHGNPGDPSYQHGSGGGGSTAKGGSTDKSAGKGAAASTSAATSEVKVKAVDRLKKMEKGAKLKIGGRRAIVLSVDRGDSKLATGLTSGRTFMTLRMRDTGEKRVLDIT